ncbi:hypothetical protein amrb99_94800 [Actinomadura sp. RB99]|nr:hypothetical protein [Actinomadura sp. RB99]
MFGPLPFGFDPRGNLVEITLMYSNLLVGGIPGSGKGASAANSARSRSRTARAGSPSARWTSACPAASPARR